MQAYNQDSEKVYELKGILVATEWDNHGQATCITFNTDGEQSYSILMNSIGKTLIKFIASVVILEGTIISNKNNKVLKVDKFQIVNF